MIHNKHLTLIFSFCLIFSLLLSFQIYAKETPEAVLVVENLHKLLINSMKEGDNSTCKERYSLLKDYIHNAFDFPTIAKLVLGRTQWKNMTTSEQSKFIDAFEKMTIATYASRFDSYSGEKFETRGFKKNKRGHYVVKAVLIKKDKEEIDFKYILRQVEKKWKIVAVSAKGVNDISVKRADYNAFLKDHSITQLINKIEEKSRSCLNEDENK